MLGDCDVAAARPSKAKARFKIVSGRTHLIPKRVRLLFRGVVLFRLCLLRMGLAFGKGCHDAQGSAPFGTHWSKVKKDIARTIIGP